MKKRFVVLATAVFLPALAFATDYNLGMLARSNKIELFNRALDETKAGAPDIIYLSSAANDGVAWIAGVDFSNGTIELEIKGKNAPGQSFVGVAFHGQDNKTLDAVYLRPFNFQAADADHRSHAIQYISLPKYDWSDLRKNFPGIYEAPLIPAPAPESWVTLKLVIERKTVSAFVNGADKPSLRVDLLNDRDQGKVGLWVGNGSDGWFRSLKVSPAAK
jgi:hypothetical protein